MSVVALGLRYEVRSTSRSRGAKPFTRRDAIPTFFLLFLFAPKTPFSNHNREAAQPFYATPLSTLHSPLSILHSPFSTLHSPLSILHSPLSTLHSPFSILHSPFFILHSPRSLFQIPRSFDLRNFVRYAQFSTFTRINRQKASPVVSIIFYKNFPSSLPVSLIECISSAHDAAIQQQEHRKTLSRQLALAVAERTRSDQDGTAIKENDNGHIRRELPLQHNRR